MSNSIVERVEQVAEMFRQGKALGETTDGTSALFERLNDLPPLFKMVAFEGAAMALAVRNLKNEQANLPTWNAFRKLSSPYTVHVDVGLGWALAEQQADIQAQPKNIGEHAASKVLDGYGYYFGLFRRRQSIRSQELPEGLSLDQRIFFDQGLGRAVWYITKGEHQKIEFSISTFATERQADLWRGVGLACAFAGGADKALLDQLEIAAGNYSADLKCGAVLAMFGRSNIGIADPGQELIATTWFKNSVESTLMAIPVQLTIGPPVQLQGIRKRIEELNDQPAA